MVRAVSEVQQFETTIRIELSRMLSDVVSRICMKNNHIGGGHLKNQALQVNRKRFECVLTLASPFGVMLGHATE